MFSTQLKTGIIIWAPFILSSANAFNLVTSKILLFVKRLNSCKRQTLLLQHHIDLCLHLGNFQWICCICFRFTSIQSRNPRYCCWNNSSASHVEASVWLHLLIKMYWFSLWLHTHISTGQMAFKGVLLTLSQTSSGFYVSAVEVFWKHYGKRRNCS